MIGIESRAVMPGPPMADDEPDLIRTDFANLESVAWWKNLGIDGLVFYSWSDRRFTPIAKAVKAAGIRLMVNMDSEGLFSPRIDIGAYWNLKRGLDTRKYGKFIGLPLAIMRTIAALLPWRRDLPRIDHLEQTDVIGSVSPIATDRIKKFLSLYGRNDLTIRVQLIPHPVAPYMSYNKTVKRPCIVCVGRWNDPVKNPALAVSTIAYVLSHKPESEAIIIGSGKNVIEGLIKEICPTRTGIRVLGSIAHAELAAHYQRAQISLCTSHYESGHIVSEEALCCGCSIVAPDHPALPSMKYYVSRASGQLGGKTPETLGAALCDELEQWENGKRNPVAISDYWCGQLHADRIAKRIAMGLGLNHTIY